MGRVATDLAATVRRRVGRDVMVRVPMDAGGTARGAVGRRQMDRAARGRRTVPMSDRARDPDPGRGPGRTDHRTDHPATNSDPRLGLILAGDSSVDHSDRPVRGRSADRRVVSNDHSIAARAGSVPVPTTSEAQATVGHRSNGIAIVVQARRRTGRVGSARRHRIAQRRSHRRSRSVRTRSW